MTKENLVLDVRPEQLVSYGKRLVAFYDGYKLKTIDEYEGVEILEGAEPELYIHIQNADDKYSVVRRRAQIRRDRVGRRVPEEKLFAKAYKLYLDLKASGGPVDEEKEALKAKVAELEAKAKAPKKIAPKKIETAPKEEKKEEKVEVKEEKVEVKETKEAK